MRGLKSDEVKYCIEFTNLDEREENDYIPEYKQVYKEIKKALEIDKEGYNVYLIDDFSKKKLENIMNFINDNMKDVPPKDICYVVNVDSKNPKTIFVSNLINMWRIYRESIYKKPMIFIILLKIRKRKSCLK